MRDDSPSSDVRLTFDLVEHLHRQRKFALQNFGPGRRTRGVINHIRKELDEIEQDPDGQHENEWIDVLILAFDGAMRQGHTPEQIVRDLVAKQTKNENRQWPDWRTISEDQPIEHIRQPDERPKPEVETRSQEAIARASRRDALYRDFRRSGVFNPAQCATLAHVLCRLIDGDREHQEMLRAMG